MKIPTTNNNLFYFLCKLERKNKRVQSRMKEYMRELKNTCVNERIQTRMKD